MKSARPVVAPAADRLPITFAEWAEFVGTIDHPPREAPRYPRGLR